MPTNPLNAGLYELLITPSLRSRLDALAADLIPEHTSLHEAEAADRIALHLSRIIESAIAAIPDSQRPTQGIAVARELITILEERIDKASITQMMPLEPGEILRSILSRNPDGAPADIEQPLTPLLDTTLLTNAPGEPRVGRQVKAEIASADGIDLLMAFIRRSGLNPLFDSLRRHCESGRSLRVLTTTYTNSTEQRALDELTGLGAQVRVSYDTTTTRLHAKAWLFNRQSGFSTAYIGSSNLTYSAQVSGLEWNVRVSEARNKAVIGKIAAVFDSYWESDDFRSYNSDEFKKNTQADERDSGPTIFLSPAEIRPFPFQERLLEQIAVQRQQGRHRNLLAAATGTGKTVMAALDYVRLREELPRARLLFVAHRREILDQSQATFRHALRDASFGEQWLAGKRPRYFEHVFASVQTLARIDLDALEPSHFDVVIVDEFHHAAAPSYDRLLQHLAPRELLGLTATPERADDLPVLHWFDGRIAAELRLWDAIDQHRLTPFVYYGVHDGVDLRQVPWKRGVGYDVGGLTNVYTASDRAARHVIKQLEDRLDDLETFRALGFCVGIEHAQFMARVFNDAGIPSVAIWGDSPSETRQAALRALRDGDVRVLFSVDLFNEGVDLPNVDTLLMLRPTDSPTLFLQQLGRGLRRSKNKTVCTVLDFVGLHRREFRFDRRLRALLGGTRKDVERQVEGGFPYLPAGCHMELDRVSQDIVLKSIKEAIPSRWPQRVEELRALAGSGRPVTLATYLEHSGLELQDVYSNNRSWSDLCEAADIEVADAGPHEAAMRRAIGRLLHIDDEVRLGTYASILTHSTPPRLSKLSERERRLIRMLVAQVAGSAIDRTASLQAGIAELWAHPQVLRELRELVKQRRTAIDHVHVRLEDRDDVPLVVHARYTKVELLAAFGVGSASLPPAWREGVKWAKEAKTDLFAFTLNKSEGGFSPSTMYKDYAINRELIHWQSQSTTPEASPTGQRYQNHVKLGSDVMLFARVRNSDRAFWFLGPGEYVRHRGEAPMSVVWRLKVPLPGDLFTAFAAAVA